MRNSQFFSQLRLRHHDHYRSTALAEVFIAPFHSSRPEPEPESKQHSKELKRVLVSSQNPLKGLFSINKLSSYSSSRFLFSAVNDSNYHHFSITRGLLTRAKKLEAIEVEDHSQRAVTTALCCNFLVFSLKFGVWLVSSSHVMLAEVVHSVADFANQALLAYGLSSSKRAPDALHPYGYSKERFVWSLISAVGIFCLGAGATIVHGVQNLWTAQAPENIEYAALVIGGSLLIEGASLFVAINAVRKGAAAEGLRVRDYIWRGHDPTSVAVMTEDGAAVAGLLIAGASLVAVNMTGNAIYDPVGSIIVGNLLGMVCVYVIAPADSLEMIYWFLK